MSTIEHVLNDTLGCLSLVGTFSVVFYGCTCGQVMYYIRNYYVKEELNKHVSIMVALLWILDTGKTAVDLVCGWEVIVLHHGNPLPLLGRVPSIVPAEFGASCCTVYIVQCCYLHTIWKFVKQSRRNQNWLLFMLIPFVMATATFVTGIIATIQVQTAQNIFETLPSSHICGTIRPACAAVFDIYITVWLCYHLQDSKTGIVQSRTDYIVTKLINYSITRGIVTSVVQIVGLVLFVIDYRNNTLWFMLFYIPASTVYVNSLLAMWNARNHLKMNEGPVSSPSMLGTWRVASQLELPPEPC
ncbi:hypothetical protein FOMPIDRAFT_1055494 [Fomitopsis schrenkii]|uniref:DUF6534 domain-containing protein n=1 Tax=Fomitopsis schrenkii TaxID=2126942 RepID=S8F4T8_FOMSC|nr:hypothetical protein FOMPIDRAFT_1055494 [Fomitopsis schrenkii]